MRGMCRAPNHPMVPRRLSPILALLASSALFGCASADPDAPPLGFTDRHGSGAPNTVGGAQGSNTSSGPAPGSNANPGTDGAGGSAGAGGAGGGTGGTDGAVPGPAGPGGEAAPGGPPGETGAGGTANLMDNVGEAQNDQVPGFYGAGADIGLRVRPGP